jgi:hypothetical protein
LLIKVRFLIFKLETISLTKTANLLANEPEISGFEVVKFELKINSYGIKAFGTGMSPEAPKAMPVNPA